jgi:hypothetical protein
MEKDSSILVKMPKFVLLSDEGMKDNYILNAFYPYMIGRVRKDGMAEGQAVTVNGMDGFVIEYVGALAKDYTPDWDEIMAVLKGMAHYYGLMVEARQKIARKRSLGDGVLDLNNPPRAMKIYYPGIPTSYYMSMSWPHVICTATIFKPDQTDMIDRAWEQIGSGRIGDKVNGYSIFIFYRGTLDGTVPTIEQIRSAEEDAASCLFGMKRAVKRKTPYEINKDFQYGGISL